MNFDSTKKTEKKTVEPKVISAGVKTIECHTKAMYGDNGIDGPGYNSWVTGRIYWTNITLGRGTETISIKFPQPLPFKAGDIVKLHYNEKNEVFLIEKDGISFFDDDKIQR